MEENKIKSKRKFIKSAALATAGLVFAPHVFSSSFKAKKKKPLKKPNLLFIFADQYRKASLGFLNQDPVKTPNINSIAKRGVNFSNSVSNHPLCSPYRGMLMTGKYPLSNGVLSNCHSGRTKYGNFLKEDDVCFSDVLSQNNYNVGFLGKWHLDGPTPTPKGTPNEWDSFCEPKKRHGFDFWYSYGTSNDHMKPHYWINEAKENEVTRFEQWSPEHEAEVLSDYLKNNKGYRNPDKPFAMFWGINPPHTAFNKYPERLKENFKNRTYKDVLNRKNVQFTNNKELTDLGFGDILKDEQIRQATDYFTMVEGIDVEIGRVLKTLKEQGLYDNTIIVFSADHGEMMGSHGLMHKNVWFKESMDIPFIIAWPEGIKKSREEDLLLSVPDIMPTILGMMGMSKDIPTEVEGVDFSGIFRNEKVDKPEGVLYFFAKPENPKEQRRGVRTKEYTYVVACDKNGKKHYFLYDDKNDEYQLENVYSTNSKLANKAHKLLIKILQDQKDPFLARL